MKAAIAALLLISSAGAGAAADAVIAPGPLSAPPAFPAQPSPVVRPGPFDAPPAYGPPPFRVYNWTGFYLGLNGGGVLGKTSWGSLPDITSGNVSSIGGLFGGTIGYNLQAGDLVVLGVEADLDWSSLKATIPATSAPSCATNCQLSVPWLATARLRGGYSFGGVLPYLTGRRSDPPNRRQHRRHAVRHAIVGQLGLDPGRRRRVRHYSATGAPRPNICTWTSTASRVPALAMGPFRSTRVRTFFGWA